MENHPQGGGPSLELPRICQQSLARTQSHGPIYLQGRLGMWSSCALEKTENSFTVVSLWHKLHVISPLIPDLCYISVTSNANRFFVAVIILMLLQSALPPSNSQISRTVTKNSKEKKTFGLPRYTSHIDQLVDPGLQPHLQPQCRWGLQKCDQPLWLSSCLFPISQSLHDSSLMFLLGRKSNCPTCHTCELEQTLGNAEGQRSLVCCCSPCSRRESERTEQLNHNL